MPVERLQDAVMGELSAQNSLREMLSTWVEVSNGEIRIKHCGAEDLERLMGIIEGITDRNLFPALDLNEIPKVQQNRESSPISRCDTSTSKM